MLFKMGDIFYLGENHKRVREIHVCKLSNNNTEKHRWSKLLFKNVHFTCRLIGNVSKMCKMKKKLHWAFGLSFGLCQR